MLFKYNNRSHYYIIIHILRLVLRRRKTKPNYYTDVQKGRIFVEKRQLLFSSHRDCIRISPEVYYLFPVSSSWRSNRQSIQVTSAVFVSTVWSTFESFVYTQHALFSKEDGCQKSTMAMLGRTVLHLIYHMPRIPTRKIEPEVGVGVNAQQAPVTRFRLSGVTYLCI